MTVTSSHEALSLIYHLILILTIIMEGSYWTHLTEGKGKAQRAELSPWSQGILWQSQGLKPTCL